ncbi:MULTISPECIES: hypothetical protein [unclassified Amycolatopsis]|uniref:hypothetical protein n=1 Tax=unclassified Amycolatopsis TaxID=2618356 RepID=UPI00287B6565|nr:MULTISPECIES: hypothetical protein [unclassified Amycolatopsis]
MWTVEHRVGRRHRPGRQRFDHGHRAPGFVVQRDADGAGAEADAAAQDELTLAIAARTGTDAVDDLYPQVVAAVVGTVERRPPVITAASFQPRLIASCIVAWASSETHPDPDEGRDATRQWFGVPLNA